MSRVIAAAVMAAGLLCAPAVRAGVAIGTVEEDPNVAHERWKQKAEDDYREAMKARAAGNTALAVRLLLNVRELAKMRINSPFPKQADDELRVIYEEARKELQVARQLVSGEDPAAGLAELKRISQTYFGLGPAKEAGTLLRQLEADPRFQATLRSARLAEDLKKAEALESQAAELASPAPAPQQPPSPGAAAGQAPAAGPSAGAVTVRPRQLTEKERLEARLARLTEAYEIYSRIVREGPDTEPGRRAAEARARLEADPVLGVRIRQVQAERKARQYLGLAENYFRSGRLDSARQFCQKVIEEFPDTPHAAEARALLAQIK